MEILLHEDLRELMVRDGYRNVVLRPTSFDT